ncbi:hypothetical protein P3W45_000342 [Vairimorpha bombi]|jgi:hypothetical protein
MLSFYEEYRILEQNRNYELIYEKLLLELSNIQDTTLNIKDTSNIKAYIEDEIRKKIFKKRGIPTFIIKIIILLGKEYEKEMQNKIKNFIVSEYATDFQVFISIEFNKLGDMKNYYTKLNQILKDIQNIYFNLPEEWKTREEITSDIYIIIKQKICDIIFFNNFTDSEYIEIMSSVIENEKKICEYQNEKKSLLFNLFAPFIKIYYEHHFNNVLDLNLTYKKCEMKIFTNFVNFFKEFEILYAQISFFENTEALKILSDVFSKKLIILLDFMNDLNFYIDYDSEVSTLYNKKDFKRMIIILNSISYLNECITQLNGMLNLKYEINLKKELFLKVGNTENIFNSKLEIYIRNLLINVDFNKKNVSEEVIALLKRDVFFLDLEDLYEEVIISLLESIILQVLSRVYLLDFDEEQAETMIYDLYDLKNFLSEYNTKIGSFNILESYLKIFMCSPKDKKTFIENFDVLSNNIFSFKQIVWSLKDKENVIELLEVYERRKN